MSEYIFDVRGLFAWSQRGANERGAIGAAVKSGAIIVVARVWSAFEDIYPDEAAELKDLADPRRSTTRADRLAAAALADYTTALFGPYDEGDDWIVAAAAVGEDLKVISDGPFVEKFYSKVSGCCCISVDEVLQEI